MKQTKLTKKFYAFHGDLDFFKVNKLPEGYELIGEMKTHSPQSSPVTGHSHTIISERNFEVYKGDDFAYVFIEPATIYHDEHRTLAFDPGIYVLAREQEENPRTGLVQEVVD